MRILPMLLMLLATLPANIQAQDSPPPRSNTNRTSRPRVGLVLGGGGARGGAHIGVLQVLEELRIPVDYIVGTSIGAIIGGLYAAGLSPEQMRAEIARIDWKQAFDDRPVRWRLPFRRKQDDGFNYAALEFGVGKKGVRIPAGIVAARSLSFLFNSLTLHTADIDDFDDLPVPFRGVATDLMTGEIVVMDHGTLAAAMRASMSIPGALTPVRWEGRMLVDGGVSANLPVEIVREMGAEVVIAVDISPTLAEGDPEEWSLVQIGMQTVGILLADNTNRSRATLTDDDILIEPALGKIELVSFDRMIEACGYGETSARRSSEALSRLSVSEEAYAEYLLGQRRELVGSAPFVIDEIAFAPLKRVPEKVVRRRFEIMPGDRIDLNTLRQNLQRVYQVGEFEQVGFELKRSEGKNRLTIDAKEKNTGPNYVRLGVRIRSVPDGSTDLALLLYHRRAFVNRLGGEWLNRLDVGDGNSFISEFYQPLTPAGWLFVDSKARVFEDDLRLFLPNGGRDVMDQVIGLAQFDAGVQVSNLLELRGGIRAGRRRTELRSLATSGQDLGIGEWFAELSVDALDNTNFPTLGGSLLLDARSSRSRLNADEDYDRLWGRAILVGSLWRNTLTLAGEAGTDFSTGLPAYDQFRAGGFLRLSGLENGERTGNTLALTTLALYRRIATTPDVLGHGLYLGLTGEVGNAWPSASDASIDDIVVAGSAFIGMDTVIGPLYTAYGIAEGGESVFYFILDTLFPGFHL